MLILLSAALRTFEVSVEKLPVAAVGVTITVARGPEAEDDQFKLYGTVV